MGLGVEAVYLTAYRVIEIKALGHSRTEHVPPDEVPSLRQALISEPQPLCVLEEVRESHLPLCLACLAPRGVF